MEIFPQNRAGAGRIMLACALACALAACHGDVSQADNNRAPPPAKAPSPSSAPAHTQTVTQPSQPSLSLPSASSSP
jgi:hypothetical protein